MGLNNTLTIVRDVQGPLHDYREALARLASGIVAANDAPDVMEPLYFSETGVRLKPDQIKNYVRARATSEEFISAVMTRSRALLESSRRGWSPLGSSACYRDLFYRISAVSQPLEEMLRTNPNLLLDSIGRVPSGNLTVGAGVMLQSDVPGMDSLLQELKGVEVQLQRAAERRFRVIFAVSVLALAGLAVYALSRLPDRSNQNFS